MKYRAIIFDLDGTIVDTEALWHKATDKLIETRHITLTLEKRQELHALITGSTTRRACALIKEMCNLEDDVELLITEKSNYAFELYRQGVNFVQGFLEFHKQVERLNLKMGIATNSCPKSLALAKEQLNLESLFGEHIYDISFVHNIQKPSPEIYLHVAEKIQVKPEHCIAIEDSAHGIAAAKTAGMFCYGINTSKKPEQLQQADLIIDGYHEIDLLEKLGIK